MVIWVSASGRHYASRRCWSRGRRRERGVTPCSSRLPIGRTNAKPSCACVARHCVLRTRVCVYVRPMLSLCPHSTHTTDRIHIHKHCLCLPYQRGDRGLRHQPQLPVQVLRIKSTSLSSPRPSSSYNTPFNNKARKCRAQLTFSGAVSSELLETAEALLGRGR